MSIKNQNPLGLINQRGVWLNTNKTPKLVNILSLPEGNTPSEFAGFPPVKRWYRRTNFFYLLCQ